MKKFKYLILSIITLFAWTVNAQEVKYKSESEYLQKTYKKDKKELLGNFLKLNKEEGEKFWPIYEAYENKRSKYAEHRWQKLMSYDEQFPEINDALADRWLDSVFVLKMEYIKLVENFTRETEVALGPIRALQAYEFEGYIMAGTRKYLVDHAAFAGEGFVKKK